MGLRSSSFPDFWARIFTSLSFMPGWRRIGYRPYFSGIGINAECPNLLIQRRLNQTIEKALAETGRKIHVIGHSLGGVIARSVAGARPKDVASVITLAAPIRGTVANRAVLRAAEAVRLRILEEHGRGVLPDCYTGRCTCNFIDSLRRKVPRLHARDGDLHAPGWHRGLALLHDDGS